MRVKERIVGVEAELPPAERKVAELVLTDAGAVAFGTVAQVAKSTGTSGPTVLRLATRLGYSGFAAMQDAIRAEVGERLRPAVERIRDRPVHDAVAGTLDADLDNVQATLTGMDPTAYTVAVTLLAQRAQRVAVVAGEATYGIAHMLASDLGFLRPGVDMLRGSPVAVARAIALLDPGDVLIAIDLRRYERWVLDAVAAAGRAGVEHIAITDSEISPIAAGAAATFIVSAASPGPFDSHVGTLALGNALVAGTAGRLRRTATDRLDRVEQAWRDADALTD